ncbi:sugar ABC transporter permease [Rhodovastum atsumiense]|uniref:Sugar ABC transporter permease n=1 Tax=Rhodovastum atsumiense TaxID=504468 RepID=A0A5M6J0T1_9PROT|nr:sugar ABC transporter permease [Rhodovastum atsumiense]
MRQRQALWAYAFLAVPAIFYSLIRFYPALQSFWLSFHRWSLLGQEPRYVGIDNYARLAGDPVFWQALLNSAWYVLYGLPTGLLLSFTIAYFLDKITRGQGLLRALYFLPYLVSTVAVAWIWRWFYQPPPIGLFNDILGLIGVPPQPFLRSTAQALPSITAAAVWTGLGFNVVIFLAGLRAIPSDYYEAARIDGANKWQVLRRITLPLMRPTILFVVIINSIQLLRTFDQVFNMTAEGQGGPLNATKPLVMFIYQTAFVRFDMGYASAGTVVLFLILLAITLIQLRVLGRRGA